MKISRVICLVSLMAAAAACDSEGVVRSAPTTVYTYNAAANIESIAFYREQAVVKIMEFGDGTRDVFDSGQYDFHVEYLRLDAGQAIRLPEFSRDLAADLDYIFATIAPNGEPEVLEFSMEDWQAEDPATGRWTIAHAFEGMGALDVYFEPPGTMLAGATPRGSVSFAQDPLTFEATPGVYHLYLTTAGNPTDIVFESRDEEIIAGAEEAHVISDPGEQGTLSIVVSRILPNNNTHRIPELGLLSRLRVVNALNDRQPRDIYRNDPESAPIFPALPFGELTPYIDVPPGSTLLVVAPPGNPGAAEGTILYTAVAGIQSTAIAAVTDMDVVSIHVVSEDKRSIAGQATFRVYNGAGLFDRVSVYIAEPGSDVTEINPVFELLAPSSTPRRGFLPGDYEITIQDAETEAILAGPELVTMADGGVYGVLLLNAADASTVDIQYLDDFVP